MFNKIKKISLVTVVIMLSFVMILASGCSSKKGASKDVNQATKPTKTEPINTFTSETIKYVQDDTNNTITENDEGRKGTTTVEGLNVELNSIYFNFDKYDLSAESRDILKKNSEWLKNNANATIRVEGHCDERGTVEYNQALGEKRAKAVKDYYVSLGIDTDRISTISYGEERPMDPAKTEEAYAKNRRSDSKSTK